MPHPQRFAASKVLAVTTVFITGFALAACNPDDLTTAPAGVEQTSLAAPVVQDTTSSTSSTSVAPAPATSAGLAAAEPADVALAAQQAASPAAAQLAALPIKGRAPKTGYKRENFGEAWTDDNDVEFGRDGCDTRNNILQRDLTNQVIRNGTHGCIVESGDLADPYTGQNIHFVRGQKTSAAVQIDHVVALSNAWQTGAQQLSEQERINLANDPLNLIAVDGPANQQKSDGDAATWLPANKAFRCTYVERQIAVKTKYRLWVTQTEHDALAQVLASCPA